MGRRDADTHLLKNLRGEHALMNIEVKGTALEHELGAIKHRQREVEMEAQGIATPSYVISDTTTAFYPICKPVVYLS